MGSGGGTAVPGWQYPRPAVPHCLCTHLGLARPCQRARPQGAQQGPRHPPPPPTRSASPGLSAVTVWRVRGVWGGLGALPCDLSPSPHEAEDTCPARPQLSCVSVLGTCPSHPVDRTLLVRILIPMHRGLVATRGPQPPSVPPWPGGSGEASVGAPSHPSSLTACSQAETAGSSLTARSPAMTHPL